MGEASGKQNRNPKPPKPLNPKPGTALRCFFSDSGGSGSVILLATVSLARTLECRVSFR